jgi:OOP family OmpA-OmpF porin
MDSCPAFTKDGLSLYFVSYDPTVAPSLKRDLYVSQRASLDEPWGPPKKLGNNINTNADEERCPYVTPDGRRLLFVRSTATGDDFYMSIRRDKKDDFGWGDPVIKGALSSSGMETAGWGFEGEDCDLTFYFGSSRSNAQMDIYQTTMDSDGNFTTPVPVIELNDPGAIDYFPVVRKDGLEIYFTSNRTGGLGGQDTWVSTRNSTSEKWSPPVNLGSAINSTANEWRSALTWDGMNMVFASNITGNYDLYKSQRNKVTGANK